MGVDVVPVLVTVQVIGTVWPEVAEAGAETLEAVSWAEEPTMAMTWMTWSPRPELPLAPHWLTAPSLLATT